MRTSRREFLRSAAAVSLGFRGLKSLLAQQPDLSAAYEQWTAKGFGPLAADPRRVLDLPKGFSYTILSRCGETMDDGFLVPGNPDGMAAFAGPEGKTILIRNHEIVAGNNAIGPFGPNNELLHHLPVELAHDLGHGKRPCLGGTTTLLYDPQRHRLEKQYLSLACTEYNCAGGPTPWNTWITCEETVARADEFYEKDHGYPFEVPAVADGRLATPVPFKAMGRFRREAVAVDPNTGIVYQTEDRPEGIITRFIPAEKGRLVAGGKLQALAIRSRKSLDTRNYPGENGLPTVPAVHVGDRLDVEWLDLENIEAPEDDLRFRGFQQGAARFARGEGMWYGRNSVYFACTDGGYAQRGQIWKYVPSPYDGTSRESEKPGVLELFVEPNNPGLVDNADNLTVAPWGDLVVCEDGSGEQFLVGITPEGGIYKIARNAADESEFAGATFAPDGKTLFVNLQSIGLTLAITGPWLNV